jgi:hypothetical protein
LIGNGSGVLGYSMTPSAAYWDEDLQREVLLSGKVSDYETGALRSRCDGDLVAVGDIFGDWREEIITAMPRELRIYSTTIPAADRRACLLHDSIYRLDLAHCSMGYWQLPMMSACLAVPSVAYDPSKPVVYNVGLNDKIQDAAFWLNLQGVANGYLWDIIIYGGIIALISVIYLVAYIRRLVLSRKGMKTKKKANTEDNRTGDIPA